MVVQVEPGPVRFTVPVPPRRLPRKLTLAVTACAGGDVESAVAAVADLELVRGVPGGAGAGDVGGADAVGGVAEIAAGAGDGGAVLDVESAGAAVGDLEFARVVPRGADAVDGDGGGGAFPDGDAADEVGDDGAVLDVEGAGAFAADEDEVAGGEGGACRRRRWRCRCRRGSCRCGRCHRRRRRRRR